jgi:hypothetical protein
MSGRADISTAQVTTREPSGRSSTRIRAWYPSRCAEHGPPTPGAPLLGRADIASRRGPRGVSAGATPSGSSGAVRGSPEQAGGMAVDGRSDLYSLGAIMYELFSGRRCFHGQWFGEYVRKHLTEMPVPPSR